MGYDKVKVLATPEAYSSSRNSRICQSVHDFGADRNTSTITGWVAIIFCTDVRVPQRINPNGSCYFFFLTPPGG